MRLFWKLIAKLYVELFHCGIHVPPSKRLFNQPPGVLPYTYLETLHGDINFDPKERNLILQSIHDWEYFTNGLFKVNIIFDLDPVADTFFGEEGRILKVASTHERVVEADGYYQITALGLCVWRGTLDPQYPVRDILLVKDRLTDHTQFKVVMMHEFGHYLWVGHIEGHGIMHPHTSGNILHFTRDDAKTFAERFERNIEDFRYFLG
jgi:hypothetical protein